MRKEQPPPINVPVVDENGKCNPVWHRWFQMVGQTYDWVRKPPDVVYTTSAILTTRDYGKIIRFDNGSSNVGCTLMTAQERDIDCWVTIIRTGTGTLTIQPDNATRVEYGSRGGRVWCDEQFRAAANLTLQLISANQFAIMGATGIWNFS